jgi:hypothetical protein
METEQIIWHAGDRVAVNGQLGRIESIVKPYGYLVAMDAGHWVSAQRDELHRAPLHDEATAARGDHADPSKSPVENYLRIVK